MRRRTFLTIFAGASTCLLVPGSAHAQALVPGYVVMLRCLGDIAGPPWLDGRTLDGSVGLAPDTGPRHSGTRWQVVDAGVGGHRAALPRQHSRPAMARRTHKGGISRLGAKSWPTVHRCPMAGRGWRRRRYCVALSGQYSRSAMA